MPPSPPGLPGLRLLHFAPPGGYNLALWKTELVYPFQCLVSAFQEKAGRGFNIISPDQALSSILSIGTCNIHY